MDYDKLKQKYSLPDLELLEYEFEIDRNAKFILRDVRRKVQEKLEVFIHLLEGILQPDTASFSQMCEINFFSELDKDKILKLHTVIMKVLRNSVEVSLDNTEENEANFVNKVFKDWKGIKEGMLEVVGKMKESWDNESKKEADLEYLG